MILESIFRGSLSPTDLVYPADPEYKQLCHEVVDLSDQLSQTLTPPQQELLEQLIHTIYSANLIESESYFSFGFSLGLELQREIQDQLQCLTE